MTSHPLVMVVRPSSTEGFYDVWLGDSSGPLLPAFLVLWEFQGEVHHFAPNKF